MPTPGLSLVGFMQQPQALMHLANQCVPANSDPAALLAEWNTAKGRLGRPTGREGNPDIQAVPAAQGAHVQQLKAAPWIAAAFAPGGALHNCDFKMVEIEPLLAFQFTVSADRSQQYGGNLSQSPTMAELMNLCLPLVPNSETFNTFESTNSMLLKAKSLNLRTFGAGVFNAAFMGIQFGASLPFVQVVRHNGRCYL